MVEAFQSGYESVYGNDKEQVLPDKDIDDNLKKTNSYAYEMIDNDEIVGGVIVTIDVFGDSVFGDSSKNNCNIVI